MVMLWVDVDVEGGCNDELWGGNTMWLSGSQGIAISR
jgi:hypothetical protein